MKYNKSLITKMFKGFRPGVRVIHKINLQYLEKLEILTSLQHDIVQDALNRCAFTKPILDEKGNPVKDKKGEDEKKLVITFSNCYIARLFAILEKPFNTAKVDHLGNTFEAPKEITDEEIEKMKEENRKGKSRKDIKGISTGRFKGGEKSNVPKEKK